MDKKNVRQLFIAIMIFLPLQYGVVGIVGELHSEPWPAFTLPGFKNVYVTDDRLIRIEQKRFLIYESDRVEPFELRPQEMFPEIPLSQVPGFMRTHFSGRQSVENLSHTAKSFIVVQATENHGLEPVCIELLIKAEKYRIIEDELMLESTIELDRIPIRCNRE